MKRLVWLGDSLKRLRAFPPEARREAGYQLERVQAGGMPSAWKPMPSVGLGCFMLFRRRRKRPPWRTSHWRAPDLASW